MNKRLIASVAIMLVLVCAVVVFLKYRQPRWTPSFQNENPAIRLAAVRLMSRTKDADQLIQALKDADADVRLVAAQRLGGEGPEAPKRIQALVAALADPHAGVRWEAAESLASIGPEVGTTLMQALQEKNSHVRAGAALVLGLPRRPKDLRWQSPLEERLIAPLLCSALKDENAEVRRNSAGTLGVMRLDGPELTLAVSSLATALKDDDAQVRANVAHALGHLGRRRNSEAAVKAVVPGLREARKDKDQKVREAAERALQEIGAKD
jgi:HEAT repeat protein